MNVDIRFNLNMSHKVYLNYPFCRDKSLRKIKYDIAGKELKK